MMQLARLRSTFGVKQHGKINVSLVVGVALLIISIAAFFTFYKIVDMEELGSFKGEARSNEYLAFERWLAKLKVPYARVRGATDFDKLELKPGDTILLTDRRFGAMTPQRIQRIFEWVESGGHLIVEPEIGEENDRLLEDYGITSDRTGGFTEVMMEAGMNMMGISKRDIPVRLPHVKGVLNTRQDSSRVGREEDSFSPRLQVQQKGGKNYLLVNYARGDGSISVIPGFRFLKSRQLGDRDNAEYLWSLLTLPRDLPTADKNTTPVEKNEGEGSGKSELNYEPGEKSEGQNETAPINAADMETVQGATDAVKKALNAALEANAGSTTQTNGALLIDGTPNIKSRSPGSVYFVELLGSNSLFSWLWSVATAAIVLFCVFFGLWLMRVIPRFGPVAEVESINRPGLREHFAAAGHFLVREGASNALLLATRQETIKLFEQKLPGWLSVTKANRARWLSEHFKLDEAIIERAFNGVPEDKPTFVRYLQVLAALRAQLTKQLTKKRP